MVCHRVITAVVGALHRVAVAEVRLVARVSTLTLYLRIAVLVRPAVIMAVAAG